MPIRGDIYYADLSPVVGCEQGGIRPILIISNDIGNRYSPTVIVAAITSRLGKSQLPTHIYIDGEQSGLRRNSVVLMEQVRTIDCSRLKEYIGHLGTDSMEMVDQAIAVSFGIQNEAPEMKTEICYAMA